MAETTPASATDAMSTGSESGELRLLFCPFCRECYEGETHCPEHELELVEFAALPRQAHERAVDWDEPVAAWDLRFGRLEIVLGVVAALVGFFVLPMAVGRFDDEPVSWTALQIATSRAPNLWTVPFVAALFAVFLYRRRTPLQMRGSRLAGIVLSLMPGASLAYSLWNVQRGVARSHGAIALDWGAGVWVMAAASVFLLVGSVRFGAVDLDASLPHGASPDDERESAIEPEREPPAKKRRRRR
jgi:hypothetical protein